MTRQQYVANLNRTQNPGQRSSQVAFADMAASAGMLHSMKDFTSKAAGLPFRSCFCGRMRNGSNEGKE
jgi:hypothetical protein